MGLGTNIILLVASIGFMMYLGGNGGNFLLFQNALQSWLFSANSILAGVGLAVAIFGTLLFPNPYTIFLGWAVTFYGVSQFIGDMINLMGLPQQLTTFIIAILNAAFIIALVSWLKGGGEL